MTEFEHIISTGKGPLTQARMQDNGRNLPQGDDDELRVLCSILDVVCDDGNIPEVESGIDLVHEVQRRWL